MLGCAHGDIFQRNGIVISSLLKGIHHLQVRVQKWGITITDSIIALNGAVIDHDQKLYLKITFQSYLQ